MMKRIAPSFTPVNLTLGQVVFHQGQEPALIYVVLSGDFIVTRRVKKKQQKLINDQDAKQLLNNNFDNLSQVKTPRNQELKRLVKDPNEYEIKIQTVCCGQLVGFDDVIGKRFHSTSLKCASAFGQMYAIKQEEFITRMQKDYRTWDLLKQMAIN